MPIIKTPEIEYTIVDDPTQAPEVRLVYSTLRVVHKQKVRMTEEDAVPSAIRAGEAEIFKATLDNVMAPAYFQHMGETAGLRKIIGAGLIMLKHWMIKRAGKRKRV